MHHLTQFDQSDTSQNLEDAEEESSQDLTNEETAEAIENIHKVIISSKCIPPLECSDDLVKEKKIPDHKNVKKRAKRKYTTGYGIFFSEKYVVVSRCTRQRFSVCK